MAVPGKGRTIGIVLVVAFIVIAGFFFNPFASNVPEGVDTDASELRSVTWSGDDYEVVTFDDELFILDPELFILDPELTEVYALDDDVTRDFISRDRDTLLLQQRTVEGLGLDPAELEPAA